MCPARESGRDSATQHRARKLQEQRRAPDPPPVDSDPLSLPRLGASDRARRRRRFADSDNKIAAVGVGVARAVRFDGSVPAHSALPAVPSHWRLR